MQLSTRRHGRCCWYVELVDERLLDTQVCNPEQNFIPPEQLLRHSRFYAPHTIWELIMILGPQGIFFLHLLQLDVLSLPNSPHSTQLILIQYSGNEDRFAWHIAQMRLQGPGVYCNSRRGWADLSLLPAELTLENCIHICDDKRSYLHCYANGENSSEIKSIFQG